MTRPPTPLAALLCLAILGGACASTEKEKERDVRWLVDHGRFEEAVREAARQVESRPDDAGAQALHREATVAWWIEQGRRKTFEDQDDEAMADFQRALEADPQSEVAESWLHKTRHKLALRALDEGLEFHANDQIPEALEAYERALGHEPGLSGAQTGRLITIELLRYRAGLGNRYFKEGLHAISDYWLELARSRFTYAQKYESEAGRGSERREQVHRLLAIERVALGRGSEEEGRFGAARVEYRIALQLDPENADAKAGLERARLEMKVSEKLQLARIEIARGRLSKARELAEQALADSVMQKDRCEGVLAELREARFEGMYRDALALERDWKLEEAAGKFGELLAEAEYYKDAIARRTVLLETVQRAADLYERAAQAATKEEEASLLGQIELIWPEYKDVAQRLRAFEKPQGP